MKKCSKCHIEKLSGEFNRKKTTKDGLRSECKSCQSLDHKIYYGNNKEKISKKCKKYYKQNKKKCLSWSARWDKNNPEKSRTRFLRYRHDNLELCRARDENYRLRNMDKDAQKTANRRSSKLQRTPAWLTEKHLNNIAEYYSESERLKKETGLMHHVDHIVPLNGVIVCGLHVPWNLQVLVMGENLRKSNLWWPDHPFENLELFA